MKANDYIRMTKHYIDEVMSGMKVAGKLEISAVNRHITDIQTQLTKGIYFDERAALKAFSFFTLLKHSKGEFSGHNFELSPWQAFIIYSLFGWKRSDGTRRFRYAYIEVARKNGKTTFAAAIALLMLVFDGEQGAEIYTAATKRDQAKICWSEAKNMISMSPALKKYVQSFQHSLVMESTISKMEPLASDSGKLDGLNPHLAICDELHAWKTDDLYNVLTSATGSRKQPLIFIITTAGLNKTYPCFYMRKVYIEILEGVKIQENTFVQIFTLDENDDWKNPEIWKKANPNYNISIKSNYLAEEFEGAINHGGTKEVNFKTKNLNLWVDAPDVWIKDEHILACNFSTSMEDLHGKECYAGLDLASHIDINALALFFPDINGNSVVKVHYWIPEAKIAENEDVVDYRYWKQLGLINTTPGNVIDIEQQVSDISLILRNYDIKNLSFDPAKAYHGVIQGLQREGYGEFLDEYAQSIRNMSEPSKYLEKLVQSGEIDLLNDPVLRWMFRNVVIMRDTNDNMRPDKKRSQNKIDGVVALITALGGFLSKTINKELYLNKDLKIISL